MKIRVKSKLDNYLEEMKEKHGIEISKAWLSREIGVDPSQLYRWTKSVDKDNYVTTIPSVAYALLLAQTLNCTVEDLFEVEIITDHNDPKFLLRNKD
ncbi:hypothetical protein [Microcystis phage MaeS]|nr:hypothetical protein [Microcystis phage MaeS]